MSYIRPNSIYEPCYPAAHNKAYTDDPLDPVYQYTTHMGDVDTRSFRSEYSMSKPQHEHPKYNYKKSYRNRRKQVTIASILFVLFFLAVVTTCILFIYFLVREENTAKGTKVPPLAEGVSVDAQLSLDQSFLTQYDDPNSQEYQNLEMDFTKAMDEIILASNYSSTYIGTTVLDFRNGSTIVGFNMNFNDIPPHLDKDVGSEELSGEIEKEITDVIKDAVSDPNSTLNSDLNAKEQSVMVNEVRLDIQPVTMSNTITTKPKQPVLKTTKLNDVTSERTTTSPESDTTLSSTNDFLSTLVYTPTEGTTKSQILSSVSTISQAEQTTEAMTFPAMTTFPSEIQETTATMSTPDVQTTTIPTTMVTSMQGITTGSLDEQTTNSDARTVKELTTELVIGQTTISGSTVIQETTNSQVDVQPTTVFEEMTTTQTIVTQLQTTEQLTTLQPTTEQLTTEQLTTEQLATEQPTTEQLTTEQLTTELTTEQLTTEQLTTEQPTTELTTEQYTTMYSSTEQDTSISPIEELTEFPANSSAAIHVFGSMVLNESFPESLNDKNSTDYISLAAALGIGIDCSLLNSELKSVYAGNDITTFKPGSIIATFTIYLSNVPSVYYNETTGLSEYLISGIEHILRESIEGGIFGNLDILKDSVTITEVTNSAEATYACQNISSDCCKNLPYQSTAFPNSFANSPEAAEEILRVLNGSCHTDSALYLCSKVYPDCPSVGASQLLPCRSFCEDAVSEFNSETLQKIETDAGSQISNCSYLNEPSHNTPCFTVEGRILTRSAAAYNEEICSTQPLHPPASARVVGGQDATLGEWPWMVSLQRFTSHQCGAVLIAPQYALTAAHCLGLFNNLELGTVSILDASPGEQRIEVEETFAHPEYNPLTLANDIAIVKLKQQVEYTDYVRPVCVSTNTSQFQVDERCYITGWGDTTGNGKLPDTLQEVALPLVDINICASRYSTVGVTVDENVVCAGYLGEGGRDACQGDSGGPLVCQDSAGIWQLYGIVSNGVECALPEFPGIYTRVPAYLDFINLVLDGGTPQYRPCNQDEFQCSHGPCINKDWQCDGHNDCRDGSDELNCGCTAEQFTCTKGDCVYDDWVCDGDYDCLDGSDEEGCGCRANQFDCGDGVCIVASYYCDGYSDCRNGVDEMNCPDSFTEAPGMCSDNKFMCDDGICIEGSYKCDQEHDCSDGTDEADCQEMTEGPVVPQCYNITSVICGDILISHKALFPNGYARNPQEAEELLIDFNTEASCHSDSMRLMCALVYQGCEDDDEAPVHPCDAMCQDVLSSCSASFQAVTQNNGLFEISCSSLPDTNCLSAPGYCDGFLCSNNHCIQSGYYCDGYNDCSDLSDESTCQTTTNSTYLCHPINVTTCGSYLPYSYAAFPNDYAQTIEIADQVINRLMDSAFCHENMMSLMCNLLFPECDGYQYEPCIDHCTDVISSCPDVFTNLKDELNLTQPITCDDLPDTNCLAGDGTCVQGNFQCADGKCIPFELTCDIHADCLDNTDESNCTCTDVQYTCSDTGICLGYYQVCDGIENCPNGEDEALCDSGCPEDFFRCANETSCIPQSYVCDGYFDCDQLNDENDCEYLCGEFEFQCKDDGYCLPNYYVCDGFDHCYDGSDEMECGN